MKGFLIMRHVNIVNHANSVNSVNSVNSYSAVLPPSPMVFFSIHMLKKTLLEEKKSLLAAVTSISYA